MAAQNNNSPATYTNHYKQDVLRKGLKFDNDRKFKNRLILKTIFLMAVLVIIATCSFIAWSKLRDHFSPTVYTQSTIIRQVPATYDEVEVVDERAVVPEVRTQFVPAFVEIPIGRTRYVRAASEEKKSSESPTNSKIDTVLEWATVPEKSTTQEISSKSDDDANSKHVTEPTESGHAIFWKDQESAETIRKAQAEKMISFMDRNADPCDDFYQYACGNWNNVNAIPDDRAGFDTFEMLRDSLDLVLKELLEEDIPDEPNTSAIKKAKILYRSCMNEVTVEKRGREPLLELLETLGGWPMLQPDWNHTSFDWVRLSAQLRLFYNDILITHWIGQDFMASSNYIIQFDQANLGLSTRDHFLREQNKPYRQAYKSYIIETALLLGADPESAELDAQSIVDFETALANITSPQDERRNISKMYEKLTVGQLESEIPHVQWQQYLSTVLGWNVSAEEPVVLFARKYFVQLDHLLQATPPRSIANYMMWRFVKHRANNLNNDFQDVKQNFLHVLFGRKKSPARWTTCVHHVNGNMGMALGSLFVHRYFDQNSKNDTVLMTHSIMEKFQEMLERVTWIDNDTKRLAQEKVEAITLRIGYPEFITNSSQLDEYYMNVSLAEPNYFENTLNVLTFVAKTEMSRLRTPADKTYWNTPPAIVNAYYSRNKNQIIFPAGILQPPFYHRHFPKSVNYGGIGVVIGHEIIHGFDDKGRLYDLEGNLHRWWKEDAIQSFHRRAKCLIDQYNSYTVQEVDMPIDGVNTQGENIADNGGIKQAFRAYSNWYNSNEPVDDTLEGINATNFQLFFINFAQIWCGAMRPDAFRNKLQTAVHPPGRFRVIGTLSNSNDFARVFNCPAGSGMNPRHKCTVW